MLDNLRSMNMRLGPVTKWISPGFGSCGKCGTTWVFVKSHETTLKKIGSECFPLCELCWGELSIEDRIPFYRQLIEGWIDQRHPKDQWLYYGVHYFDVWEAVKEAVEAGG